MLCAGVVSAGVTLGQHSHTDVALGRAPAREIDGGPVLLAAAGAPIRAASTAPSAEARSVTVPLTSGGRLEVTLPAGPGPHPRGALRPRWRLGRRRSLRHPCRVRHRWRHRFGLGPGVGGVPAGRPGHRRDRSGPARRRASGPAVGPGPRAVARPRLAGAGRRPLQGRAHLVTLAASTADPAIAPDAGAVRVGHLPTSPPTSRRHPCSPRCCRARASAVPPDRARQWPTWSRSPRSPPAGRP